MQRFPFWIRRWLKASPVRNIVGLARLLKVDRSLISHWIHEDARPIPTSPYWPCLLDELGLSAEERADAHRLAGVDPLWLLTPEQRAQVMVKNDLRDAT